MGTGHAKNILAGKCPEIKITAVADLKEARIAEAKKMFAEAGAEMPEFFSSGEELLAAKKCESVIICVPHYGHVPFAVEAFAKGYHVMVEKPAGVCTADVRVMNKAAKESGKVFGMMFNQRTNCVYRKIKEMIDSGELGAMRRFNWIITSWYRPRAYYDSGDWRATWSGEGGGVLLNQCPHQLDLWQWFCGMPRKISANLHFGKWHDIEVEDDVTAYVEYENGATGVFISSTGDAHGTNRFEIQMDSAKLVVENDILTVYEYEMSEQQFSKTNTAPFGSMNIEKKVIETPKKGTGHVGVLNAWADAMLRGGDLIADGREGINGLTISNAMHLSSFINREISLPFNDELFYTEFMKRVATSQKKKNVTSEFADTAAVIGSTKS